MIPQITQGRATNFIKKDILKVLGNRRSHKIHKIILFLKFSQLPSFQVMKIS